MLQQFDGDQGEVARCGQCLLPTASKTVCIDKGCRCAAELFCACIHAFDKSFFGTAEVFGDGNGAVVRGTYGNGFQHFIERELFALFQPDLRAGPWKRHAQCR